MSPLKHDEIMAALANTDMDTMGVLHTYGVKQVVTVHNAILGVPGTSIYLIVEPLLWSVIAESRELNYPMPLLRLYDAVGQALQRVMPERNLKWINNEALGAAFFYFEVNGVLGPEDGAIRIDLRKVIGSFTVPRSDFWQLAMSISQDPDHEPTEADKRQLEAAAERDGGWMAGIIASLPIWGGEGDGNWLQLTVLPSSDVAGLSDADLERAVKVTRFGWNLLEGVPVADEVAEIRRQLAAPSGVSTI